MRRESPDFINLDTLCKLSYLMCERLFVMKERSSALLIAEELQTEIKITYLLYYYNLKEQRFRGYTSNHFTPKMRSL